jgi:hypothetical protein
MASDTAETLRLRLRLGVLFEDDFNIQRNISRPNLPPPPVSRKIRKRSTIANQNVEMRALRQRLAEYERERGNRASRAGADADAAASELAQMGLEKTDLETTLASLQEEYRCVQEMWDKKAEAHKAELAAKTQELADQAVVGTILFRKPNFLKFQGCLLRCRFCLRHRTSRSAASNELKSVLIAQG